MIDKKKFPKAYVEVLEIIKYIPKKEYDKIPKVILQNMENEKDASYTYTVSCFDNFQKQDMLKETEVILAVFYRDYWATPYQRERIEAKEKQDIQVLEQEKRQAYNPDDLFKKKQSNEEDIVVIKNKENYSENLPIEIKKETLFKKLIVFFKGLFNRTN